MNYIYIRINEVMNLSLLELANKLGIVERVGIEHIYTSSDTLEFRKDLVCSFKSEKGIHIPSYTVYQYYKMKTQTDRDLVNYIFALLQENGYSITNDNGCINTMPFIEFCSFCLFHEEGHWDRILNSNEDEIKQEIESNSVNNKETYELSKKKYIEFVYNSDNYIDVIFSKVFGTQLDYLSTEMKKELHEKYRQRPNEIYADKFAVDSMVKNMKLVINIIEEYCHI